MELPWEKLSGLFFWFTQRQVSFFGGYAKAMQKKYPVEWAPVVLNPDTVTKEQANEITG